jgi:hypothetical protein
MDFKLTNRSRLTAEVRRIDRGTDPAAHQVSLCLAPEHGSPLYVHMDLGEYGRLAGYLTREERRLREACAHTTTTTRAPKPRVTEPSW